MLRAFAVRRGRWRKGTGCGNRALCVHSGPDNLEELLDKHVVTGSSKKPATEEEGRRRLTSTRRESLALYRDIFRATRLFLWPNEQGILWRDVLRSSTRKEFEEARFEQDPEIIARLLVGGRDALQQAVENAIKRAQKKAPNNDPPQ
ncbi:hypothetical protein GOP47_0019125 [Adiantum capillus-veneris]|uniref:Complex 1 LYR protein domain-containing protein n=1 Tax=Adiantum capillus-veneris TaxID=13818 RepID=A0A9D4UEJ2_ADICA|nr:hypothetical protein GOP47_0019125 [Adiantum capillus-veneris]